MSEKVAKTSKIEFNVDLNENQVPLAINWSAEEVGEASQAKAMFIALWDEKEQNTMKIDLWTKDMMVDEMKMFFHQTMLTMADSFERATGEVQICGDMRDFCHYFAERMQLIAPENPESAN